MEATTFNGKSVYTLTQVGESIQSMIERTYTAPYYIKAEMVKLNLYARTGHCYPELVEKEGGVIKAQMRAIIWSSQYLRINERFRQITGEPLRDGITVLCLATIQFSPKHGLALYIQDIEPSFTLGEMAKTRRETIARLKQEGVFDANRRLKLPLVPKRIAIISIETSKGYSDFMITLQGAPKHYCFETELFPSLLQGEKAVLTMNEQLSLIERRKEEFDCVAIIRGGGGDVGLGCYDHYELAQRVATFPLPVLSGIGHSTNETVTEMVSFASKITPTEVAYFIISRYQDFEERIADAQDRIYGAAREILRQNREAADLLEARLSLISERLFVRESQRLLRMQNALQLSAKRAISDNHQRLADVASNLRHSCGNMLQASLRQCDAAEERINLFARQLCVLQQNELRHLEDRLRLLDPANILRRGFSITLHNGHAVSKADELQPGDEIVTRLFDGTISSRVEK